MKPHPSIIVALAFTSVALHAAEPAVGGDAGELAKKLSNPVASLISVPFQFNCAGNDNRREVNATFLQPFVSFTTPKQTTYGLNAESTYNWNSDEWTIPFNLTISQLVKIGGHPVQFMVGGRYYAESPAGGPEWGLRAGVTLLFPQ
jgi:hypothetical protein